MGWYLESYESTNFQSHIFFGSNYLAFNYSGSTPDALRLVGNQVAIGHASPSYTLDVQSSGSVVGQFKTTGSAVDAGVQMVRTGGTANSWYVYLPSGSTDIRFNNGSDRYTFNASGTATATNWSATSDIRLKDKIVSFEDGLRLSLDIATVVRKYRWKNSMLEEVGFVAQELFKVAPEYVFRGDDDGQLWSVNYSKMVVPLYGAIKTINDEVTDLKRRVAELEAKLAA
jgi:hypothetical protein